MRQHFRADRRNPRRVWALSHKLPLTAALRTYNDYYYELIDGAARLPSHFKDQADKPAHQDDNCEGVQQGHGN